MDDPASFKSEVNWRSGGPEYLWLLDGILRVPAERKSAESCRRYVEGRNLSSGMFYIFHISKEECRYNFMWNNLSLTSLKVVFLTERSSPSLTGRNSSRCRVHKYSPSEGSDKRRTPYSMRRHFIGLFLQPVGFPPENIDYSASCTLSKKACFYRTTKKTIKITDLSRFELWIHKMTI
jgi:hypothetical protein